MQKKRPLAFLWKELVIWNRILEGKSEKIKEGGVVLLLHDRDRAWRALYALCDAMKLKLVTKRGLTRKIYLLAMVRWVRPTVNETRSKLKSLEEEIQAQVGTIVDYGEIVGSPF
jgi:hypothetical protein